MMPGRQVKETTMQYLLLIYGNEAGMQSASKADMEQMMAAYGAYTQAMKSAGVLVAADRLKPSTAASTVRIADGKTKVLDGPYAETKEQLGGLLILEARDMNHAVQLMAQHPAMTYGNIFEIRPAGDMNEVIKASEQRRRQVVAP
jgi:hypothetical protein